MHKTVKRAAGRLSVIAAAAFLPMAFTAAVTPAIGSADCAGGQWWDPVANVCQAPLVPNCTDGWWDPVANTCRPAIATTPLACDNGWWWDPVGNVCRPPLLPPQ
ncbi:uncharacterized protein RMCC_4862 [Mycolicibacterium canariasense]|uniref:Uncharacterized protein n=1 Tax=Mycolicibacterium canariasense TaxID=228230 RepID=A0A100WG44_MYCCR|nr:hypothetical protein AWB94_04530 [Mycolicibacterium canariasense]GAS97897.1 uncharacterized protein RMCC_4862 [Mycolicibacterium canariasense]